MRDVDGVTRLGVVERSTILLVRRSQLGFQTAASQDAGAKLAKGYYMQRYELLSQALIDASVVIITAQGAPARLVSDVRRSAGKATVLAQKSQ